MKQIGLLMLSGAVLALAPADRAVAVSEGDSLAQVLEELGQPGSYIQWNGNETLYYDRGKVQLAEGAVVEAQLVSAAEAKRQLELGLLESAQRQEELRLLRERRVVEGAAALEALIDDPAFQLLPASSRLARWRAFRKAYPETPFSEDYFIAMRERELELKEEQAARRLRELEAEVAQAEAQATQARNEAYDSYQRSRYYSPVYYGGIPVVHSTARRSRSRGHHVDRNDHGHHTQQAVTATFVPFNGTAGYAFQRNLDNRSFQRTSTISSRPFRGTSGRTTHSSGTSGRLSICF
jgi:hypothetical protein